MNIRQATSLDKADIRRVHLDAFPEGEGEAVAKLAVDLLSEESAPGIISLVAESEDAVVGHVAFSPVTIDCNEALRGYILAPLGVVSGRQRCGIGAKLIERGVNRLTESGVRILFVYGDPKYYGRFGFSADAAGRFIPPYKLQYSFGWQAKALYDFDMQTEPARVSCVNALCDPMLW